MSFKEQSLLDRFSYTRETYSFPLKKSLFEKGNQNFQHRVFALFITKTSLFKYIENFTTQKTEKFSDKNSNIFYIFAQNIDCGYSLEPTIYVY